MFDRWTILQPKLVAFGTIGVFALTIGCTKAPSASVSSPTSVPIVETTPTASHSVGSATALFTKVGGEFASPTAGLPPSQTPAPSPSFAVAPSSPIEAQGSSTTPTTTVAMPTASPTVPRIADSVAAATPIMARSASISNVSVRTAADAVAFLRGQLPDYPESGPSSVTDFSPSDILETMDTIVLDQVLQNDGATALQKIYDVVANDVLLTVADEYPNQTVVVALDAGHGGKPGFFWDSGSEGTEAEHTRAVVRSILRQSQKPEFARLIVRPIFNDAVADDLGMPAKWNRPTINQLLVRQVRAAMLQQEASVWNNAHPASTIAVHEISIHFNAGAGGALVLNQGDTVRPEFQARSVDFGRRYLQRVIADLNATGLLPTPLRRWGGNGLHDDVMMYRPAYMNGLSLPAGFTPRYGLLQGLGYMPRYIQILLAQAK